MSDLDGIDSLVGPGHEPSGHLHDGVLHDILGAHGLADITDPLHAGAFDAAHSFGGVDQAHPGDLQNLAGVEHLIAPGADPAGLVGGLEPVQPAPGSGIEPLLVDPSLLGSPAPGHDGPVIAFTPGSTAFDLGPDPLGGMGAAAWAGVEALHLPDIALHDAAGYAAAWNLDPAGDGAILAVASALGELHVDAAALVGAATLEVGGVLDVVAGPGGLPGVAAEMWAEAFGDAPLPVDSGGRLLPPDEILAELVARIDDPAVADVAQYLLSLG